MHTPVTDHDRVWQALHADATHPTPHVRYKRYRSRSTGEVQWVRAQPPGIPGYNAFPNGCVREHVARSPFFTTARFPFPAALQPPNNHHSIPLTAAHNPTILDPSLRNSTVASAHIAICGCLLCVRVCIVMPCAFALEQAARMRGDCLVHLRACVVTGEMHAW
jgi:hypothetical protein